MTQYLLDSNHSVASLLFKIHSDIVTYITVTLAEAVFQKSDRDTYRVSSESWYDGVKWNRVLVKEVIINDLQNVDIKLFLIASLSAFSSNTVSKASYQ